MQAQIQDIATNASPVLFNPLLLTVPVVGLLALVTGFAGRVAILIEDLYYRSTNHADEPGPVR